jgi:predicted acetyltransferase
MPTVLILPSSKYFASYLEACRECEEAGERSFLHDIHDFGNIKRGAEVTFAAWQRGIKNQYYYDSIDGKYQRIKLSSTTFWLVDERKYLGIGIIRHRMTKAIEEFGGHIGYAVRRGERNKGYGKLQLKLLLREAFKLKINPALVTCDEKNRASARVIEVNGGKLWDKLPTVSNGENIMLCRYWVPTNSKRKK